MGTAFHLAIRRDPLDAAAIEARVEVHGVGATCAFKGIIRPHEHGREIASMAYSHYDGMAQAELRRLAEEAAARWELLAVAIEHRVGDIPVGEAAVVVATAAPHRAATFDASRWLMDAIKQRVPIWKASEAGPGASECHPDDSALHATPPSSTLPTSSASR